MKQTLTIALALSLLLGFGTGCALLKDAGADLAKDKTGEVIARELPAEYQEAFLVKWTNDPKEGIKFAAEVAGVEALARALEKADAANKELADQVRAGGSQAAKDLWIQIALALAAAGAAAVGRSTRNKWAGVAQSVIRGVQGFLQSGPEGNQELKAEISRAAKAAGTKATLDQVVAQTVQAGK